MIPYRMASIFQLGITVRVVVSPRTCISPKDSIQVAKCLQFLGAEGVGSDNITRCSYPLPNFLSREIS